MKAVDYLSNLINWGNVFVPFRVARAVRDAAVALGYSVCAGEYDAYLGSIVLYLDNNTSERV